MEMRRVEKRSILEELDATSRVRPLTESETRRMRWALQRAGSKSDGAYRYWSQADLLRLRRHLLNGKRPAQIAILLKRTERSIWRKMNLLGWTVHGATIWIINPQDPR